MFEERCPVMSGLSIHPVLHTLSVLSCVLRQVYLVEAATGCYGYVDAGTTPKVQEPVTLDAICANTDQTGIATRTIVTTPLDYETSAVYARTVFS